MTVTGPSATRAAGSTPVNRSLAALDSEDFLKLLVVQLTHQDPTSPMDNKEILEQISSLRALESSTQLTQTIRNLAFRQEVNSGAALLGRQITAVQPSGQLVAGRVTGVRLTEEGVYLAYVDEAHGEQVVPMMGLLEVRESAAAEPGGAAGA